MISLVIPVYNEEKNVALLQQKLSAVLSRLNREYEIIYVDDGSTDQTFIELEKIQRQDTAHIKIIQFTRNFEKSAALMSGFSQAQGEIIITMDGDLQDEPEEIHRFIEKLEAGYDCVTGWKVKRHDPFSKTFPSRIFNFLVAKISKLKIHDFNCGFKAYTREAVLSLNLYGGLYRFIPAILNAQGFKITEIGVLHHERKFGISKYGAGRFIKGFFDITTLWVLLRFSQKPSHFFGNFGILSAVAGLLIIVLLWKKLNK